MSTLYSQVEDNKKIESTERAKKAQRAALVAALCAAFLAIGKFILFLFTGSLVVALSAWDSAMDVVVSLINRKIVAISRLEADANHPYGHGRIESISALGQGCLIIGGAIGIISSCIHSIYDYFYNGVSLDNQTDYKQVIFFIFAAIISLVVTKWLKLNGKNSTALLCLPIQSIIK